MTEAVPLAAAVACAVVAATAAWRARAVARARRRARPPASSGASPTAVPARRGRPGPSRDDLAEVVDVLASALRVGTPPVASLRAAGLDAVAVAVERGRPLAAALDSWAGGHGPPGADLVAAAVAVTAAAGGDPGRALAAVADTLRERRALRREVRALSSQARLSAAVIGVAPVGFAAVAVATDGSTAAVLLGSPLGLACLVAGLALDGAGWWWMDRITRTVA